MKRIISTFSMLFAMASMSFAQAPVKDISGNLNGTHNWSADTIYLLKGKVYVKAGGELNIAPGTVIKGDVSTPGSALIVTRGAQIFAIGTATKPIVFTSSETPGNRQMGDWGGLVIAGNARINVPGGIGTFEGGNLANPDGTVADGQYGGLNDLDNSGELKYVRIEYAGFAYAPNNELNSLTMGGVGSGTKMSYIQCSHGLDDHFEWFGGSSDASHLVSFRCNDDDFDTDFGYSGRVQFGVALRDTAVADPVSGSMAFESDNDGGGNNNTPKTRPVFSNMTIVGPKFTPTTTIDPNHRRGAHIRRHSQMSLFNSVIMGYPTGIKIDGDSCHQNADNGLLKIKNTTIAGCTNNLDSTVTNSAWPITSWFNTSGWDNNVLNANTDVMLANPFDYNNPDFRPNAGSPLLNTANFADPFVNTWFASTTFRGAFGSDNWMAGWTNFQPDTNSYLTGYVDAPNSVNTISKETISLDVYPNPSSNNASIRFNMNESATLAFELVDISGKVVMTQSYNATKGFNVIRFSTETIPSGLYIIKLNGDKYATTEKLSVLH
mgnify:CR=1 FL=1